MFHRSLDNQGPPPFTANAAFSPAVTEAQENACITQSYQQKNGQGGLYMIGLFETFVWIEIYQNHSKSSLYITFIILHWFDLTCMFHRSLENQGPPPFTANAAFSPAVAEAQENVCTTQSYGKGGLNYLKPLLGSK